MKREELWTPSARRFECLLKAAQNGDYNAYMSLMARFFKVMDDKARNNYLRDYEMFTALVERVSEGIFGFSTEDAYQRELNKENHPSKKRKKQWQSDAKPSRHAPATCSTTCRAAWKPPAFCLSSARSSG